MDWRAHIHRNGRETALLGILVYSFLAIALGAWLPPLRIGARLSLGAMVVGGYALVIIALFVLHAALTIELTHTLVLIAVFGALGALRRWKSVIAAGPDLWFNPLSVFLAIAGGAILFFGGIDYLPYTNDEFSSWIGAAKIIHLGGGLDAVGDKPFLSLHTSFYTPGWRLILLLPWQISDSVSFGDSAPAPLVLHLGVVTLFFEILRAELVARFNPRRRTAELLAWAALLLYLAAEGTGRLWTYNLLIEQPQIYSVTALFFFIFIHEAQDPGQGPAFLYAGLTLTMAYLLKTAALLLVPALLLAAAILSVSRRISGFPANPRMHFSSLAILIMPIAAAAIIWSQVNPYTGLSCLASPLRTLTPGAVGLAAERDWLDLLRRFSLAVTDYLMGYKTPLLITGAAGAALAVRFRRLWAFTAIILFAGLYWGALYWYHLACFGDYYFEHLNFIQRFSRVVVQPFHALGLLALSVGALRLFPSAWFSVIFSRTAVERVIGAMAVGLLTWQVIQIHRTVVDVSTRKHQPVDPRIIEVQRLRRFVDENYSNEQSPLVQIISQGTDRSVLSYARSYALGGAKGNPRQVFRYIRQSTWTASKPVNVWQTKVDPAVLARQFKKVDIIWPMAADDWVSGLLRDLVQEGSCPGPLARYVLVKRPTGDFTCVPKPGRMSGGD